MDGRPLIAIFCSSFPPEGGAASQRMYRIAKLLLDAGYRVEVVCSLPNYPYGRIFRGYRNTWSRREVVDGIAVQRCWVYPSNSGLALPRALSLISQRASFRLLAFGRILKLRPALVITSSPPLPMAGAAVAYFAKAGIPVLLNVSDIWPLSAKVLGAASETPVYRYLQRMEGRMYRNATAFCAQSREILDHIAALVPEPRPALLLRNLPAADRPARRRQATPGSTLRILYPGLLGHAQGLLPLIRAIDWAGLGASLDIYGSGAETEAIRTWLAGQPGQPVRLHEPVPQRDFGEILRAFDAMLIPLVDDIPGAVPSKLFTAIHAGLPVLYHAGGEGAGIVRERGLGFVSRPGDYDDLALSVTQLKSLSPAGWENLYAALQDAAVGEFEPGAQDQRFLAFVARLAGTA